MRALLSCQVHPPIAKSKQNAVKAIQQQRYIVDDLKEGGNRPQMGKRVMPELMGLMQIMSLNDGVHRCYRARANEGADYLKGEKRREAENTTKLPLATLSSGKTQKNGLEPVSVTRDSRATEILTRSQAAKKYAVFAYCLSVKQNRYRMFVQETARHP
jgi:hypothetical protein